MQRLIALMMIALLPSVSKAQASFQNLNDDGNGIPALRASLSTPLTIAAKSRAESLRLIAQQSSVNITFDEGVPDLQKKVSMRISGVSVASAILSVVRGAQLSVLVNGNGQVAVVPRSVGQPGSAVIRGQVRDSATGDPIEYARVSLLGTGASAVTRNDGTFQISGIRSGDYSVAVTRIGFRPTNMYLSAADISQTISIGMRRAAVPLAVMRIAPSYGVMEQDIAAPQTLTREEIQTNPQVGEDIFRAVNRLPGLAANDMSARFYARGGSQDELYVTLDGMELYEPFHLKDIDAALSIIDVDAIRSIDLSTGGFTADYGNRLTGVFTMRSADAVTDQTRTSLGLSVTNLRGGSQGGFSNGKGAWLVSLRRGYLDLALKLTNAGDSISPQYYDAFAKVQYDLGRQKFALHLLQAVDRLNYLDSFEPSIDSDYGSTYGWMTLGGALTDRISHAAVLSLGRLTWNRNGLRSDNTHSADFFTKDVRSFNVASLKEDVSYTASESVVFRTGAEVKHLAASYDYLRWQREDVINGQGKSVSVFDTTAALLSPTGNALSAYLSARFRLASSLVAEVGGRFDSKTYGFKESVWSPRLNAAWTPLPRTTVRGALGKYFQFQNIYGLAVQDGLTTFSPAELANHAVLGVEQRIGNGTTLSVEGYDRALSRVRPMFVNALNEVNAFPESTDDRQLVKPELSNARGVEFFLKRSGVGQGDFSASYAFGRIADQVQGKWIPRAVDQRHTLYLDGSLHSRNAKWRLSAGALYHSGSPYTPAHFLVDTLSSQNGKYWLHITEHVGTRNSGRLPAYYRFDFRATRYFAIGDSKLTLFADLFNAFNRRNARGYEYNLKENPIRIERAPDGQIPRLPTIGLTWEF